MEANQEAQSAKADVRKKRRALNLAIDARLNLHEAQALRTQRLIDAVRAGCSVADIADALGISRTAVYKQLGRKEER